MIRSLRTKLALSHILPLFLLLPLLSLYLLYSLENFYTESLLQQLVSQAYLLRMEVENDPRLIATPTAAQTLLGTIAKFTSSRVILLDQDATILASSRKEDAGRVGTHFEPPAVSQALSGGITQGIGPGFRTEVAYAVLPLRYDNQTLGALRLSYEVDDVRAQFDQLRWLVLGGFALTAFLSLGLSLGLSATITRPLRLLTGTARSIAKGNYRARVPVQGKDEVGTLAETFNEMVARLEQAELARDRQLAAIAHELARPLTGMRAGLEALQEDMDIEPATRESLLEGVGDEMDRLERLISTLQGLHKRALRPIELVYSEVNPDQLIRACLGNMQSAADRLGIKLDLDIPAGLPSIRADQDRLIQLMTNLLDNALKFTPRGGLILVQTGAEADAIWIRVADTGVGIMPEELPNIFQQFYRGDESRPPEKRGMGLGLAICREIVNAHGGRIWVESEPGKGATFAFTLPRR